MQPIASFSIQSLALEGFKCFGTLAEFTFSPGMSLITGHNGTGKSTLGDAVAYAIAGVPMSGESGLDRLYSNLSDARSLRVTLTLTDGNGAPHQIVRTRENDQTIIVFDGLPVRQMDLTDLFGERDVFLSIFNPLYFIERLGEKGRELLERYLPAIPHEAIMAALDPVSRAELEGKEILSAEGYMENLRAEISQLKRDIIYLEGQRDQLTQERQTYQAKRMELAAALDVSEARMAALTEKRDAGFNCAALEEQRAALYARFEERTDSGDAQEGAALNAELQAVLQKLEECRARVYQSPYMQVISEQKAAFEAIKTQYLRVSNLADNLVPGNQCPTCRRWITQENLVAVRGELTKDLETLMAQGQKQTASLSELTTLEGKSHAAFEQYRTNDMEQAERLISELRTRQAAIQSAEDKSADLQSLRGQLALLEAAMDQGNLTDEEFAELEGQKQASERLSNELDALDTHAPEPPNEKEVRLLECKGRIQNMEKLLNAASLYLESRVELQFKDFTLNRAAISLYDLVKKTGELKSVFKFTYEGRPYHWLSASERLKAGLEVSALVMRLTGRHYPVFMDDSERVARIDNIQPTGQILMARMRANEPLAVRDMNAVPQTRAA